MKTATNPLYFLPEDNAAIKECYYIFKPFVDSASHTVSINVHKAMIEDQDTANVHKVVMALQHYPKLIHKLLFSLEITFSEREGSKLHIANRIWQQDPAYHQWFHRLMDFPFLLFFLHNEDARYYALIGDLLASRQINIGQPGEITMGKLNLTTEQTNLVQERLFTASLSLLFYCHGSGFNPVIYIQGLLAFFDASFTYEDVLCEYATDVLKGSFRISVPQYEQE